MKETIFLNNQKVKLAMDHSNCSFAVQMQKEEFANKVYKLLIPEVGKAKPLKIMALQKQPVLNLEGKMSAQEVAMMLKQTL